MKKILCPVDFLEASKNGMEYAARLARNLEASLSLLYVRTSIWPEAIQLEDEVGDSNQAIEAKLSLYATEIKKEFGVSCDFHLEWTTDTFEETMSAFSRNYDLVVMGTNGADNFYQYVFGSHSFQTIEKSKCPVILVPEGHAYQRVKLMVYAYDPGTNPLFLIDQLKKMAGSLEADIRVLHISEEDPSSDSDRKIEILAGQIMARQPKKIGWSFDHHYSKEVASALTHYMKEHPAQMLALSFHHRSLLDRLLRENVVKQISMLAEYPVYVFWH